MWRLLFLTTSCGQHDNGSTNTPQTNTSIQIIERKQYDQSLGEVNNWFKAWDIVYKDVYNLKEIKLPYFVLFDETYVYTTSKITGKDGISINGPSLSDKTLNWIKKAHKDKITLPDSTETDVRVMSFASQLKNGHPFFVMPLTSYWRKNKVNDHGIGIDTLVTCVFLHEFGHTQQMQSFNDIGAVMEAYSKIHPNDHLSDDIMQEYYENDSLYLKPYKMETDLFRKASLTTNKNERLQLTKEALELLKKRQKNCFEKDNRDIATIDNFFLTLEGIGQYSAFVWLRNPKGGNLTLDKSLKVIKTKWWSQEQGFDIIFLLSKFMTPNNFAKFMFGAELLTSIQLLEKQVME